MRKLFFLFLLGSLPTLLAAQSYNTAGGVRLGTDWGLSLRQRLNGNIAAELILQNSLQNNREEAAVTLLGIVHKPLLMRNLNLFTGGGIHAGWSNGATGDGSFGLDVLAGIELSISRLNLSWDIKPALNLSGGNTLSLQSGVSLRYILWKREKYEWEKNAKNKGRGKKGGPFDKILNRS